MTINDLQTILSERNYELVPVRRKEYQIELPEGGLKELCAILAGKTQLLAMFANDERQLNHAYRLYLIFGLAEESILTIVSQIAADNPVYQSVTSVIPAAHWYEREIKDQFGIQPVNHPDPRRLVFHYGWPKGTHPMRKDFQSFPENTEIGFEGRFPFKSVTGEGVTQAPVGPIHAGIIEPGHFRFHIMGESILELEARLFYTHRGLEKLAEGKPWKEVIPLTERICGVCAVSHSLSFAMALEKVAGLELPRRANLLRMVYAELERVYNHLNDIGAICAGVGLALGAQKAAEMKEEFLQLNDRLTGHRYLRGAVIPGGVSQDLDGSGVRQIQAKIGTILPELANLWERLSESDSFLDRLQTTGVLTKETAKLLGAVGPTIRASGISQDTRKDFPYAAYNEFSFEIPTCHAGDVFCRLRIRVEELKSSFDLINQVLAKLEFGVIMADLPETLPPLKQAFGISESARGSNLHWLMTGVDGTIYRYMIRSASYPNWPVLVKVVPGNIIPDFPLINKSFELCYACLDR